MAKILVTGGSGFIPSNLVDRLAEKGHEVINFDRLDPKYESKAKYLKGNILDLARLVEATKGVEYIFHLAAEANVDIIKHNPVYATQVNTIGTINVFEAARINGCKRVLFASTDWTYGATLDPEVSEETKLYPPSPSHIYMSGKIASEMYCSNYRTLYGVDYTIMRFGIPYGPRARRETVVPIFLRKAFNGEPITIHGSGEQFRQFIHVYDLVDGCIACLSERGKNEIFNLNGPEKVTIKRIAETIKRILKDLDVRIVYHEAREGDFKGRLVDSSKALKLLGWKPVFGFDQGMEDYVKWCRANNSF
jgi:UDP-glucose 4-epimerase